MCQYGENLNNDFIRFLFAKTNLYNYSFIAGLVFRFCILVFIYVIQLTCYAQTNDESRTANEIVVEAEHLINSANESEVTIQAMQIFGADWSNDKQLLWQPNLSTNDPSQPSSRLELTFEVPQTGYFDIWFEYSVAPDYGNYKIILNEKNIDIVGFSTKVEKRSVSLGINRLVTGPNKIKFEIQSKSSESDGYLVGLDAIKLQQVTRGVLGSTGFVAEIEHTDYLLNALSFTIVKPQLEVFNEKLNDFTNLAPNYSWSDVISVTDNSNETFVQFRWQLKSHDIKTVEYQISTEPLPNNTHERFTGIILEEGRAGHSSDEEGGGFIIDIKKYYPTTVPAMQGLTINIESNPAKRRPNLYVRVQALDESMQPIGLPSNSIRLYFGGSGKLQRPKLDPDIWSFIKKTEKNNGLPKWGFFVYEYVLNEHTLNALITSAQFKTNKPLSIPSRIKTLFGPVLWGFQDNGSFEIGNTQPGKIIERLGVDIYGNRKGSAAFSTDHEYVRRAPPLLVTAFLKLQKSMKEKPRPSDYYKNFWKYSTKAYWMPSPRWRGELMGWSPSSAMPGYNAPEIVHEYFQDYFGYNRAHGGNVGINITNGGWEFTPVLYNQYGDAYPGNYGGGSTFAQGLERIYRTVMPYVAIAFPAAAPFYYASVVALDLMAGRTIDATHFLKTMEGNIPEEYRFAYRMGVGLANSAISGDSIDEALIEALAEEYAGDSPEVKQRAKAVYKLGLGLLNGKDVDEAAINAFLNEYDDTFPELRQWYTQTMQDAELAGYKKENKPWVLKGNSYNNPFIEP